MSLTPAEKKLRKLTRLPANCICANCGAASKVGFSTICIKYHTFVCSNCKSSHQAISHRCKSVTMSTWNDAEVEELRQKGNDYARRTWLKNAPPVGSSGRPKQGDQIDVFKRFVVDAYERKRYYGEDEGPQAPAAAPQAPRDVTPQAPPVTRQAPPVRAPVAVAAPAPAPVVDLLDFSAPSQPVSSQPAPAFQANFDAFGSPTPAPAPAASQSGFGFISSSPAAAAPTPADPFAAQPTTTSAASASGFGFMKPPPAAAPPTPAPTPLAAPSTSSGSAFGFNSSSPVPAAAGSTGGGFADFSGISTSTPVSSTGSVQAVKKPIMGNSNGQAASMISSMNMSSQSKSQSTGMGFGMPQPCFGGGMQSQPGFGGGGMQANMMGFSPQQQMMMMQQHQMMMQQQRMMQQNMMGMNMNNNGMTPMMGGMNSNGMNGMMMGNQRQMGFGNGDMGNANPGSSAQSMNSLDMNVSSMSAYTSGGKK